MLAAVLLELEGVVVEGRTLRRQVLQRALVVEANPYPPTRAGESLEHLEALTAPGEERVR